MEKRRNGLLISPMENGLNGKNKKKSAVKLPHFFCNKSSYVL